MTYDSSVRLAVLDFSIQPVCASREPEHWELPENATEAERAAQPYLAVSVRPVVDGVEPTTGYVFDIVSLLARGTEPSEFDPYTCSCGVAGCAGIFDCVKLDSDADTVSWTFPEEPFRKQLTPPLFETGRPLRLVFGRAQYEQALADVQQRLLALEAEQPLPVVVLPDSHPDLDLSLSAMLARAQVYTRQWLDEQAATRALFGPLLEEEVLAVFPDQRRLVLFVRNLAQDEAERLAHAQGTPDAGDELLESTVVPAFLADQQAVLEAVRRLTWDDVDAAAWRETVPGVDTPEDSDAMARNWPLAVLSVRAQT